LTLFLLTTSLAPPSVYLLPPCQVLGKRLGAAVKAVSAGVRALTSEQVLAAQAAGSVTVGEHKLALSDIKVRGAVFGS
jgi:hypothetical protein